MNDNIIEQDNQKNESKKSSTIVKVLFIILLILFLLSLLVLALRIGDFLPNGVDIFFIEPKEPEVTFGDDKVLWSGDAEIDIFYIEHKNDQGVVTVVSGSGDKVIAPGTKGYYKFNFKNVGNIAVDYNCSINVSFDTTGIVGINDLPITVRLKDYEGKYLIGSENKWEKISEVQKFTDSAIIGKNSYVFYEFEWCWAFESGNDELDTLLGNISSNGMAKLVVDLSATAVQSEDYEAIGGLQIDPNDPRTGGNIVPVPYIVLNLLILILLIILLILKKKQRDKESAEFKEAMSFEGIDPSLVDMESIVKLENYVITTRLKGGRKSYKKNRPQKNMRYRTISKDSNEKN